MTSTDRPDLRWGYGARLRASRLTMGMTTAEFATHFRVSRRTVQRIERGDDPLPLGLWADVRENVNAVVEKANRVLDAIDNGPESEVKPVQVLMDTDDPAAAAVVAVAYLLDPESVTPVTEGDEHTMREDEGDDPVSRPLAVGGADRS